MTLKTLAVIEVIISTLLTSGTVAAAALASSDNDKNDEDDYDLTGLITADPVNGECIGEYDLSKDGQLCGRGERVDCDVDPDNSLCNGQDGRHGHIFCDVYAGITGSRIAYGGCYERNDTPENYCVNYLDGNWNFCENADICDDEGSISSTDPECTEKGSPCPESYIRYGDY
jgi:hypothetical protein